MKHFSSYYQNAYGRQIDQDDDMLLQALSHKYVWHLNGEILWGHVANKTHILVCTIYIDTTLGKVLTKRKRLPNMTL